MIAFFASLVVLLAPLSTASAQLQAYTRMSVAPDGNILSECEIAMLDSNTVASYPSVTAECTQLRNGTSTGNWTYKPTSSSVYGSHESAWIPTDQFQTIGSFSLNLYSGTDPLGYSHSSSCGPYYTNYPPFPPIQIDICGDGQIYYPNEGYVGFYSATGKLGPPVVPFIPTGYNNSEGSIIAENPTTIQAGDAAHQFTALRLDSHGSLTTSPASGTWSLLSQSQAAGTMTTSGLYTPPSSLTTSKTDYPNIVGSLCSFCIVASSSDIALTVSPTSSAPAPTIILGTDNTRCGIDPNIASTNQTPMIGQEIAFVGCPPPLPSGSHLGTQSWTPQSPNSQNAVGNFSVSSQATGYMEALTPLSGTSCSNQYGCPYAPFFLVTPGIAQSFTFTYTIAETGAQGSATVTFTPTGPHGVSLSASTQPVQQFTQNGKDHLALGNGASNSTAGIIFTASQSEAPGTYYWVQVVTEHVINFIQNDGLYTITYTQGDPDYKLGLDVSYPYNDFGDAPVSIGDSPGIDLLPTWGFYSGAFRATMFLLWAPPPATTCQSSGNCVVPVPLASASWGFSSCTVNSLSPNTTGNNFDGWVLDSCSSPFGVTTSSLSKSTDYPIWNQIATP